MKLAKRRGCCSKHVSSQLINIYNSFIKIKIVESYYTGCLPENV